MATHLPQLKRDDEITRDTVDPDEDVDSETGVSSLTVLPNGHNTVAASNKQSPANLDLDEDNHTTPNIRTGSFVSPQENNTLSLDTASGRIEKVNPLLFVAAFGLCAVFLVLCGRKRKFGWSQSDIVATSKELNSEEDKNKGQYTRIDNVMDENDDRNDWDEWEGEEPKERSENSEYGLPESPPPSTRVVNVVSELNNASTVSTPQNQAQCAQQQDESAVCKIIGSPEESVQEKHDVFSKFGMVPEIKHSHQVPLYLQECANDSTLKIPKSVESSAELIDLSAADGEHEGAAWGDDDDWAQGI